MKTINKPAGFWIRILSMFIDLVIFSVIAISSSLIAIKKNDDLLIIVNWGYYIWMLLVILEILILFIIIPIILKGKTIGMLVCQINFISLKDESIWLMILKRNQLYAFLWIFSILVTMCFISPELFQKMSDISNKQNDNELVLETWESTLIAIPATTSGIIIFIDIFSILSINVNKNMYSINDRFVEIQMIYSNKYIEIFDEINKEIQKEKVTKKEIIWKD
ncbi:MAG: RDD family protein [Metamycoplasmataceae bacterium]